MPTATDSISDSSTVIDNGDDASHQRKDGVKVPEGRTIEDLWAENQRKSSKIIKLESDLNSTSDRIAQLEEKLKDNGSLSAKDKSELSDLNKDLNKLVQSLENQNDESSLAWKELITRKASSASEKKALELLFNNECERQEDFLNDKVEELNSSLKEGETQWTLESLSKAISPFSVNYKDRRPERKAQLSYKDWTKERKRLQALEERERRLTANEESQRKFRETGREVYRGDEMETRFEKSTDKVGVIVDALDRAAEIRKQS